MRKFAVLGKPIQHSLSPLIYQAFAKEFGHLFIYEKIEADEKIFLKIIKDLIHQEFYAINFTAPLKNIAYKWANIHDASAQESAAANMLLLSPPSVPTTAYNTDGLGLALALENIAKFNVLQKNILIIGAGGAVQGILPTLFSKNPKKIYVLNRSSERSLNLKRKWPQLEINMSKLKLQSTYDLIIHATPARLITDFDFFPANIINSQTLIYDMTYFAPQTVFMQWAQKKGANHMYNGLSMLVAQAAYNYQIWYQVWPKWQKVYEDLSHGLIRVF